MNKSFAKGRYELLIYDNYLFTKKIVTKEEFLAMDLEKVDHVMAIMLGLWCFRTADGRWIKRDLSQVSIGTVCLKIMECIQCEPGEFFTPQIIAEITQIDSMKEPNNLSVRLSSLRLKHHESGEQQNFFLSKRTGGMGVCWNPEKSFMILTRIESANHQEVDET